MKKQSKRSFASDNNAGVHPHILNAMIAANTGHVVAYGDDEHTRTAVTMFRQIFGQASEVFFVYNGTGANVLGLASATRSYHAVICAQTAHINVDECGAPEHHTGCKLLAIPTRDGKLRCQDIQQHLHGFGFEHHAQPLVISITQPTEMGTLYRPSEIREIADLARHYGLYVHMDGARIANAAVALGKNFREITADVGVDLLSFGGTKNGMMFGEAIVFFNPELAHNFKYIRKQGMQLNSKMRYVSAQFTALLSNGLWRENALNANKMARVLALEVSKIPAVHITQAVETNAVFAILPPDAIPRLQKSFFFYVWNEALSEVRWMTSFDTQEADIDAFVANLKQIL